MKNKTAILIASVDDTNLHRITNDREKIALDYSIVLNTDQKIKYLFNDIPDSLGSLPYDISRNWYRDLNGKDRHKEKYSLGMMLEKRVAMTVSSTLKLYYGFLSLSDNYLKIEIPENYPEYMSKVINIFKKKITLIADQKYSHDFKEFFKKRGVIKKIKINIYSRLFRLLQKPFMPLLKNKTMVFPDWTYADQKNINYLYQNKVNIFKSFYFKDTNISNVEFQNPIINVDKLKLILSNYNIEQRDINNLIPLILNIIDDEIKNSNNIINQQYNVMKELLLYYHPSKIIIPDDGDYPWYNMLMQVADTLKIDVITVLDGYLTHVNKKQIRIKEDGFSPLVKNYATMGTLNHNLVGAACPKYNRIFIKPPLSKYLENKSNSISQYDVLIMMSVPDPRNTNSRWDMRNKYVIDIVNLLVMMDITKIAIKVKPGLKIDEISFLQKYFIKKGLSNIDFLKGYAHEAIAISDIVIGQLGTTLYECSLMKKSYYIYEPKDHGLSDDCIISSVTDSNFIARDIGELSDNISAKKNVKIPIKYLIDGPAMSARIN